jgi:predicted 2-oxoglutarate/Fe(II)-dependent dioxygenase YbiX
MVKMLKEEIAPGIVVYSNVIPNSEKLCHDIEEGVISTKYQWQAASVKENYESAVNKKTRDTDSFSVPYKGYIETNLGETLVSAFLNSINNIFFESFNPIEKDYMGGYGSIFKNHDDYTILRYGVGQHFANHIDDHPDYHRRVSTIYYINDDYLGGEIEFPRFNVTIKPKANQMIMFPSTYVYNHSVKPVTEGTRYAVVSWIK